MEGLGRMDVERRYLRHEMLEEIGLEGQKRLCQARILVVGAGGLGSPVLSYLCAAGIGTIGIVDDDRVSVSNLQRQILYSENAVGELKVDIAKERLSALNSDCVIEVYPTRLSVSNAALICSNYELILDCTDNIASRYLIDKISKELKIPFIYGGIREFSGQVSVFNYKNGPSFSDLFPKNEGETVQYSHPLGVVGALPGIIGSIQAIEAIKVVLGIGDILSGKVLSVDLLKNSYQVFSF